MHVHLGCHRFSDAFWTTVRTLLEIYPWTSALICDMFHSLSNRAKDAIVLKYAYVGMRIGVYEELMSKDHESFLILLNKHLDVLDSGHSLNFTRSVFQSIETAPTTAKMSCFSRIFLAAGLMTGFDLLPQRVRNQYQLKLLSTWWQRAIQKILIGVLWFFYPMTMWLPPRGLICLILILQPQLRPAFIVRGSFCFFEF